MTKKQAKSLPFGGIRNAVVESNEFTIHPIYLTKPDFNRVYELNEVKSGLFDGGIANATEQ